MRNRFLVPIALCAATLLNAAGSLAAQPVIARPNVVLILADDLGWTDLACFGSDFYETPQPRPARQDRDEVHAELFRLHRVLADALGVDDRQVSGSAAHHGLDSRPDAGQSQAARAGLDEVPAARGETTIAKVFKSAGYATASIGKWHLGDEPYFPEQHGFDVNVAGLNAGSPPTYFAPYRIKTLSEGMPGEYLTDRLGEEAAKFIERSKEKPFFLYLPHFAVHTPIQGRADLVEKYTRKLRPGLRHTNVTYAAMVESLDAAVGRVLDKLDELKLADRTIVAFTADNGGLITRGITTNAPLRLGKASAYEGGVRVPAIVRWPGVTKAGSTNNTPVITMDWFMTLLDAAGLKPPPPPHPPARPAAMA